MRFIFSPSDFAIASALSPSARLIFACHPRVKGIVENILEREQDADLRVLPYGAGNLKVKAVDGTTVTLAVKVLSMGATPVTPNAATGTFLLDLDAIIKDVSPEVL